MASFMEYLFIAFLWAAYCAIHSYLISIAFTNLMMRKLKKYYAFYRMFYVLLSFVLLFPIINYSDQIDDKVIIVYSQSLSAVRYALAWGSVGMFAWAFFFNYDALSFFGIRQILNLNKGKDNSADGELKRNGLLGLMRHPMYFALILFLWCHTFRMLDIIVNIVLTIYIIIGARLEERKLILEFGETYIGYQDEVPMLIPFTKSKRKK
jgi:protein-S-isoprenylcysteine O-methyltransferase Ste14